MKKIKLIKYSKTLAVFLLFLCCNIFVFGQDKINLNQIKKDIKDTDSPYNYERLTFKFRGMPQSLDSIEAQHLYYGKVFTAVKTNPFGDDFKAFSKAFQDRDFDTGIKLGQTLTYNDPTNIEILLLLLQCYEQKEDQNNFVYTLQKFRSMSAAVFSSGDGEAETTPYLVNSVGEEYVLLTIMKVAFNDYQRSSRMSKNGTIDRWTKGNENIYIKVLDGDDFNKK